MDRKALKVPPERKEQPVPLEKLARKVIRVIRVIKAKGTPALHQAAR
jgi:hypothetical protein